MSLKSLLHWAANAYAAETPSLDHSVGITDAGGSPEMKPAPAAYLGLLAKRRLDEMARPYVERADNWRAIACRTDSDGRYITPMRCALERIPDPGRRSFLRALLSNVYFPSDVAELYGIPRWAAGDVAFRSLEVLRQRYAERPPAPTRTSEQQQIAEKAA